MIFATFVSTMTKEELVARLRDIEWDDFEVKAAKSDLPKNVWETVSAFSNTSGGWIVLGVKQSGKSFEIQGVDNIEKLEQDFLGTLRSGKFNQTIFASSKRYDIDGCNLLAFHIPEADMKPVYFGNPVNSFIRMGSGDQRATEGEIRGMFRNQSFGNKTEETIRDTGIEMLNLDTLRSYRFALGQTQNLLELREVDDVEFCEKVNITNQGQLTYAGLLMFGKAPYVLRYVPTFCIDYIEIPAPTIQQAEVRYTYRIPEQENIWEAIQIIMRRLRTLVDAPIHIKEDGFAMTDDSQYNVLREALANMVMHCDHFDSLRSCIRVYTDHIEFMNGGAFPLPVKDILGKVYSKLRNPTIAKLFRYVGIAENAGYGMNKLVSWETLTGMRPIIESERTIATVTFPLKSALQRKGEDDNVPVNVPVNVPANLTETQHRILELIRNNPAITHLEMAKALSITDKTAKRATKFLREIGLIERTGSDKNGKWVCIVNKDNHLT